MSSARRSMPVLIAGAFLIVRPVVEAQWFPTAYFTTFAPANDVSFTISTDRESYGSDDTISVKYEIANISGRSLFVPQTTEKLMCPPVNHVTAWLASADGHYGAGSWGGGGSCGKRIENPTQRMNTGAVLLKPGEHSEGVLALSTKRLPPGVYRVEANLSAWKPEDFSPTEQAELATLGAAVLRGEVPASAPITLTAAPTSRPTESLSSPPSSIPLVVVHPFSDEISFLRVNDQANGILIELDGQSVTGGQPFTHPLSAMSLQVWLLLKDGRTVTQREQPEHVGVRNSHSFETLDAMNFLFDYFAPTELAGVVVSVNGKMSVRQIHVPAIPRRTPEREQQASR
jgi:hypothetical protein